MDSRGSPPKEFTSVPLEDLYPLGKTAQDPSLVSYAGEDGYVVRILPESGGVDVLLGAAFVLTALLIVLLAKRRSG